MTADAKGVALTRSVLSYTQSAMWTFRVFLGGAAGSATVSAGFGARNVDVSSAAELGTLPQTKGFSISTGHVSSDGSIVSTSTSNTGTLFMLVLRANAQSQQRHFELHLAHRVHDMWRLVKSLSVTMVSISVPRGSCKAVWC